MRSAAVIWTGANWCVRMHNPYTVKGALSVYPERLLNCNMYRLDVEGGAVFFDPSLTPEAIRCTGPVVIIAATHGHFDHVNASGAWKKHFPETPYVMIGKEVPLLDDIRGNASASFGRPQKFPHPDRELRDGERCVLDDQFAMEVISTPGHTMGSACYMLWEKVGSKEEPYALITGDTLFDNGWGRTDFATGDDNLMRLTLQRLYRILSNMPPNLPVCAGHGSTTTAHDACHFLEIMGFFA